MEIIAVTTNQDNTIGAFIDTKYNSHSFSRNIDPKDLYQEETSDGGYIYIIDTECYYLTPECFKDVAKDLLEIHLAMTGEDLL